MGLPRSTYLTTDTLGPLCLPAGVLPVSDDPKASEPPAYLLVQASQLLWLVYIHDSYKCSLTLTLVSYPNPSPGWSFQGRFGLAASTPFAKRTSAHCQEGFIPVKDAPWAHASIGSQRRDAGFRLRLDASAEQSKYATSCRRWVM